jgi:hypothetical protein
MQAAEAVGQIVTQMVLDREALEVEVQAEDHPYLRLQVPITWVEVAVDPQTIDLQELVVLVL